MIIHGDVVEGLKNIDSESVDCLIIDPPYNIGKDFGNNKRKQEIAEYVDWSMLWYYEAKRTLKPSGTMFIYGFSEVLAHLSVNMDMDHRWLAWHYTNKTIPSLNFWQRSHETILCAWKDKDQRIFNRDDVREPYTKGFINGYKGKNRTRPNSGGRFGSKDTTTYKVNEKGALPRDVLKFSALAGGAGRRERFGYSPSLGRLLTSKQIKQMGVSDAISHPTQKPIALTERLLSSCLPKENQRVVIPFSGTGSECYVCEQRGYDWTSFELNDDYVKMGNLLIKNGFPKND